MKKPNRKLVWLLLIAFVFTIGSGFSARKTAELPAVGETVSGFRAEKVERLEETGGRITYLTHEASGAAAVYIESAAAAPALTLAARTANGVRRRTLTADSAEELLRGAKESLGAFFGGEETAPDGNGAYRAFLSYLLPGSDAAGNGAAEVTAGNMLAIVCAGAESTGSILAWLDGVFSGAPTGETITPDETYRRIEKPVEETAEITGDETGGVYFGIVCPRAGEWTRIRLAAVAAALGRSGSLLDKRVRASLPDAAVSCGTETAGADEALWFFAPGLEEKDAEAFRDAVLAALRTLAGSGLSAQAVETLEAAQRLEELTFPERDDLGAALCEGFAAAWARGDAAGYPSQLREAWNAAEYLADGSCAEVVREELLENERTALLTVMPEPAKEPEPTPEATPEPTEEPVGENPSVSPAASQLS